MLWWAWVISAPLALVALLWWGWRAKPKPVARVYPFPTPQGPKPVTQEEFEVAMERFRTHAVAEVKKLLGEEGDK